MKKGKPMNNVKAKSKKPSTKKAHVTLVKPNKPVVSDPGGGCRPTGVQ